MSVDVVETSDGGLTIEVDSPTGKNLFLAMPSDRSVLYFAARDSEFRRAGIVKDSKALISLTVWLESSGVEFPTLGLELG